MYSVNDFGSMNREAEMLEVVVKYLHTGSYLLTYKMERRTTEPLKLKVFRNSESYGRNHTRPISNPANYTPKRCEGGRKQKGCCYYTH